MHVFLCMCVHALVALLSLLSLILSFVLGMQFLYLVTICELGALNAYHIHVETVTFSPLLT